MLRTSFLLCISCILPLFSFAQSYPELVEIPGGKTIVGGGYQYEVVDYRIHYLGTDHQFEALNEKNVAIGEVPAPNNRDMHVTVSAFYLAKHEVTNFQYREFLIDSLYPGEKSKAFRKIVENTKKNRDSDLIHAKWQEMYQLAAQHDLLPDTVCWHNDFNRAYNAPLVQNYFQHPAFDEYPVVGVSWKQAQAYCAWLSRVNNAARAAKGLSPQPDFRLPNEVEWEFAARASIFGPSESSPNLVVYPWPGANIQGDKGQYRANIKVARANYVGDGYEYTAPVTAFEPNAFGLYNMAGNVAEWTYDVFRLNESGVSEDKITLDYGSLDMNANPRVVKGGSWADYKHAAMCGSRTAFPEAATSSRVGFRVAMIKAD